MLHFKLLWLNKCMCCVDRLICCLKNYFLWSKLLRLWDPKSLLLLLFCNEWSFVINAMLLVNMGNLPDFFQYSPWTSRFTQTSRITWITQNFQNYRTIRTTRTSWTFLFPVDRLYNRAILRCTCGTRMVSLFRSQTNNTKVAWFQHLMFRWVRKVKNSKQEISVFAKTLQNQAVKIVFSKLSVLEP